MINIEKEPKESNHDYALRVITENIINLELKPGSMVSEQDLANELYLSRTPVHQALQELEKTKIIEILPQKGILVSLINMKYVEEVGFIRLTIESAITEETCDKASEADIQKMEENINLLEFYSQKNNIDKFMELDNQFHELMYKITNKMLCYYTVKLMNIHHQRFRKLRLHTFDSTCIIEEHKKILEAIKKKNKQEAKQAFINHLNRMFNDVKEIQNKYPDYFLK